jgi:hypothetical protein
MQKANRISGVAYAAPSGNPINPTVESYVLDSELNGELGLDLHEIAKSLGVDFKHVKEKYLRMEKANRIKGVAYAVTIDSGTYTEKKVESFVLDLDNAKTKTR